MCQIDINDLPERLSFEELRLEREEQLKRQELIKLQSIEKVVCKKFKIEPENIRTDTREPKICIPRNVIFAISVEKTKLKEKEIGEVYGFKRGRVHHAKKVVSDLYDTDKKFRNTIIQIQEAI